MKKIVNGLLYDTYKAKKICTLHTKDGAQEILFKTKKGNWFIFCISSCVAEQDIFPMSNDEVLGWVRGNNFIDTLIKYFPEEVEEA